MVQSQRRVLKTRVLIAARVVSRKAPGMRAGGVWSCRGSSDHPVRAGAVQNLQEQLQHLANRWPLLEVVDGGEDAGIHAALDLLEGGSGVHQELGGDVGNGQGHRPGLSGDSVPRSEGLEPTPTIRDWRCCLMVVAVFPSSLD